MSTAIIPHNHPQNAQFPPIQIGGRIHLNEESSLRSRIPDAVVESIQLGDRRIHVVRDDLLPGGTKQRGLMGALTDFSNDGKTHFIYVSPFCGYAQLALSYLCHEMGFTCTLFCERDPQFDSVRPHAYTTQAREWGAEIHLVESLAEGSMEASQYCRENKDAFEIPLGFDCEEFYRHYRTALETQWRKILGQLPAPPKTLWVSIGSGTLLRSFQSILKDSATKICGVNVHVLQDSDPRISGLTKLGATVHSADLAFAQPTSANLGFPSNRFYDAKVIPFLEAKAQDGDLFWNVGR